MVNQNSVNWFVSNLFITKKIEKLLISPFVLQDGYSPYLIGVSYDRKIPSKIACLCPCVLKFDPCSHTICLDLPKGSSPAKLTIMVAKIDHQSIEKIVDCNRKNEIAEHKRAKCWIWLILLTKIWTLPLKIGFHQKTMRFWAPEWRQKLATQKGDVPSGELT